MFLVNNSLIAYFLVSIGTCVCLVLTVISLLSCLLVSSLPPLFFFCHPFNLSSSHPSLSSILLSLPPFYSFFKRVASESRMARNLSHDSTRRFLPVVIMQFAANLQLQHMIINMGSQQISEQFWCLLTCYFMYC